METNTITRVSIWGGIGLLTIGTLYFLASQGNQSLRSDALSITPATCSLPSEIEAKTKEKESLVEAIKNTLKEKQKIETDISSKTELLTATTVSIKNLQEQILSDESLTNEEKKSSNLLAQKNKKIILGGLLQEVNTKKNTAESDKNTMDRLYVPVPQAKSNYDIATKQYNDKVALDLLAQPADISKKPSDTQYKARLNVETLASAADISKKPSDAQMKARKNVDDLLTAMNTAKKAIPSSTRAANYTTATTAYNKAVTDYNAALTTYNTTYSNSTKTYAQLSSAYTTALTAYNNAVTKYTTALTTYNTTYSNNSSTAAQLLVEYNKSLETYNKAVTDYNAALTKYTTVYGRNSTKTTTQLLTSKESLSNAYDTVNNPYVSMKNTYETVSKPAYETILADYTSQKNTYDSTYSETKDLSSIELDQKYKIALDTYKSLVEKNNTNKDQLRDALVKKHQYENDLEQLNTSKSDREGIIITQNKTLGEIEAAIIILNTKICPTIENSCKNGIDDDRDGTQDCEDSNCSEDAACKPDVITCTVINNEFQFNHSNGDTDFSHNIVSIGGTNPEFAKYEIQYSQTEMTLKADVYIDGVQISCPAITTTQKDDEGQNASLQTCDAMIQDLQQEEQDVSNIHCTGQYSFVVEKSVDKTPPTNTERNEQGSLLSSFFSLNMFNTGGALKSDVLNDCSSQESELENIDKEIKQESESLRNTRGAQDDLQQELNDLKAQGDALNDRRNGIEADTWAADELPAGEERDTAMNELQSKRFQYSTDVGFYNAKMDGLSDYAGDLAGDGQATEDRISDLRDDYNQAEKKLEDCRHEDNNNDTSGTTSGTDTTSGTTSGTDTTSGTTSGTENCGNGTCDTGEDSNSCSSDCGNTEYCGDGTCNNGETSETCTTDCYRGPYCGDGTIDSGEQCDGGEHCSECQITPYCGDGTIDAGEECDGGSDCDACKKITSCGNGTVESGEECDDGNTTDDDGCSSSCQKEECDGGDSDDDDSGDYESSFISFRIAGLKSSIFSSKQCTLGCKYKKASNYNSAANKDDGSCTCDNRLNFYDSTHKHSKSCQCDLFYEPKDGVCVKAGCKNGLNKDSYPDCKCPGLRDIVVNGQCKTPSWPKSICSGAFNVCAGKFTFGAISIDAGGRLRIPFIR